MYNIACGLFTQYTDKARRIRVKNMRKTKNIIVAIMAVFALGMGIAAGNGAKAAGTKAKAAEQSERTVRIGEQIRIKSGADDVKYKSSDSTIACVDEKGYVTGKKEGKTTISVRSDGEVKKKYTVYVELRDRKPQNIPVAVSEISIEDIPIYDETTGITKYQHIITNNSKKDADKVEYYYSLDDDPNEIVTLTAKDIWSGESVEAKFSSNMPARYNGSLSELTFVKVKVYSGKSIHIYNEEYEDYFLKWSVPDTKPPKITGLIKEKSYTGDGDIIRTYYSDMKKTYNFTSFVSAYDERDGVIEVEADTSKIKWDKEGTYKLWFTAEDNSGNKAKTWANVRVYHPKSQEKTADSIIRRITKSSWSKEQKARAIYRYIRGYMSYSAYSPHSQWRTEALRALRYRKGNCYTHYSISRLLLLRAGIPCIMIKRYPTPGGRKHYWNLAYINGGWYHFDTTPRSRNANFCLWTDAQLWSYASNYVFKFRLSYYPERAKKRL